MVLAYTAFGEAFFKFGMDFAANSADYEFRRKPSALPNVSSTGRN
jgi:hypothetical protein